MVDDNEPQLYVLGGKYYDGNVLHERGGKRYFVPGMQPSSAKSVKEAEEAEAEEAEAAAEAAKETAKAQTAAAKAAAAKK